MIQINSIKINKKKIQNKSQLFKILGLITPRKSPKLELWKEKKDIWKDKNKNKNYYNFNNWMINHEIVKCMDQFEKELAFIEMMTGMTTTMIRIKTQWNQYKRLNKKHKFKILIGIKKEIHLCSMD